MLVDDREEISAVLLLIIDNFCITVVYIVDFHVKGDNGSWSNVQYICWFSA